MEILMVGLLVALSVATWLLLELVAKLKSPR